MSETTKYGIEGLKKLIHFGCSLMKQAFVSGADGWSWKDAFSFIDEAAEIPGVAKTLPEVAKEVADLDATERQEIYDYLVAEFDIPNDRLEAVVEKALGFAINGVGLYEEFKAIKK